MTLSSFATHIANAPSNAVNASLIIRALIENSHVPKIHQKRCQTAIELRFITIDLTRKLVEQTCGYG